MKQLSIATKLGSIASESIIKVALNTREGVLTKFINSGKEVMNVHDQVLFEQVYVAIFRGFSKTAVLNEWENKNAKEKLLKKLCYNNREAPHI